MVKEIAVVVLDTPLTMEFAQLYAVMVSYSDLSNVMMEITSKETDALQCVK